MDELIICVAPYPGEKQEEKFPGRMEVVDEVIRSHDQGASIAHLHVRDENGLQTTNTRWFQRDVERIHSVCPMIIEGSTGGAPEHPLEERCVSFTVPGVEMGSLNLGSINMFDGVYQNPMSHMRFYARELKKRNIKPFPCIFDLSQFHNLKRLEREGLLRPPHVCNLVFDIPDTLPFSEKAFEIFLDHVPRRSPWFLTRHHAQGWKGFRLALERGGHVRVGYEDGPFLASGKRSKSNADLVAEIARAARAIGRNVVGPDRARKILKIG